MKHTIDIGSLQQYVVENGHELTDEQDNETVGVLLSALAQVAR